MTFYTQHLVLEDVPSVDARPGEILRFAAGISGYAGVEADWLKKLLTDWHRHSAAMSLDDILRVLYVLGSIVSKKGGPSGPYDQNLEAMRRLIGDVRARLERPTLEVWRGDITTLEVDAVVSAANEALRGGGGVDRAIHQAAGPELIEACLAIPEVRPEVRCPRGQARITPGFQLPARWVIHTVGPVWHGRDRGESGTLAAAYRSCLQVARGYGLETVAFPAISTGIYGAEAGRAAGIAARTIRKWQESRPHPTKATLVAFDDETEDALRAAVGA
ncbi:macro domain-containing protein [Rubrivirga sp.]|uniref:macro domain-containing protein n=1 Tax=Rubrivirga sp. TaxID=1885344 RepID=UPI003C72BC8B